jgi:hypothetical protein
VVRQRRGRTCARRPKASRVRIRRWIERTEEREVRRVWRVCGRGERERRDEREVRREEVWDSMREAMRAGEGGRGSCRAIVSGVLGVSDLDSESQLCPPQLAIRFPSLRSTRPQTGGELTAHHSPPPPRPHASFAAPLPSRLSSPPLHPQPRAARPHSRSRASRGWMRYACSRALALGSWRGWIGWRGGALRARLRDRF